MEKSHYASETSRHSIDWNISRQDPSSENEIRTLLDLGLTRLSLTVGVNLLKKGAERMKYKEGKGRLAVLVSFRIKNK